MKNFKEFFQDEKGRYSSARLFTFLIVIAVIVDWMHSVFTTGIWKPEYQTIGLVLGSLGFKVLQKKEEKR